MVFVFSDVNDVKKTLNFDHCFMLDLQATKKLHRVVQVLICFYFCTMSKPVQIVLHVLMSLTTVSYGFSGFCSLPPKSAKLCIFGSLSVDTPGLLGNTVTHQSPHMESLECVNILSLAHTPLIFNWPVFTRTWLRYVRVFAIAIPSVVCLSVVCLSSVTLVHPTQEVESFGKISSPLCTLAILWPPCKILRRSSQGNPSVGGVKRKRDIKIERFRTCRRLYLINGTR